MILLLSFFLNFGYTQTLQEEKEVEIVDFNSLKEVLKKDGLDKEAKKKQDDINKIKVERTKIESKKFNYPNEVDFINLANEYWLVKNAHWLKWDVDKPDYGIEGSFSQLLQKLGIFEIRFKVLIVDTPIVPHFVLPAIKEPIFILSLPFMRTLDLSRTEISLLLLENLLRHQEKYILKVCGNEKVAQLASETFEGKKADLSPLDLFAKNLQSFINESGFSFQQQFNITKKMDALLKSNPELWNAYIVLLNKIDRAVKSDNMFSNYNKLYPSPEMQIKWLSPSTKNP